MRLRSRSCSKNPVLLRVDVQSLALVQVKNLGSPFVLSPPPIYPCTSSGFTVPALVPAPVLACPGTVLSFYQHLISTLQPEGSYWNLSQVTALPCVYSTTNKPQNHHRDDKVPHNLASSLSTYTPALTIPAYRPSFCPDPPSSFLSCLSCSLQLEGSSPSPSPPRTVHLINIY